MNTAFRNILLVLSSIGLVYLAISQVSYLALMPVGVGIGVLFSVAYIGLIVGLIRFSPWWPKDSHRNHALWVLSCLAWGGGVCMLVVTPVGSAAMNLAEVVWPDATMSLGGAYPEEPAKALGVVIILMSFRSLNRPWHGLATGLMVGLGFETAENLGYGVIMGMMDPVSDAKGATMMWVLRLIMGPCLHITFTGIAGWAIGCALFTAQRSTGWRIGVGLGGLAYAFTGHFLWNYLGSTVVTTITSVVAAVLIYPMLLWILIVAWKNARTDTTYVVTDGALTSLAHITYPDPEYSSPTDSTPRTS